MISKPLVAASTKPLILSILQDGETYGYRIIKYMKEFTDGQLEWSFGMLYPVLHRLERESFIKSEWKLSDKGRLRKYYSLTDAGYRELAREKRQWQIMHGFFSRLWDISEMGS